VVFVCDAFSAMTSRRCYSRPRGRREALAELLACAGSAFDPAVVEAFRAHAAASGLVL
jgi:HD-GYP domain-containing protein (c-di-GMP phosphodiesterase class II)